ncbi:MAG TPA: M12 family metallopeptidase [Pseudobacter sp.]|nr:M12 family metallopeptidase [Pseudobacter sp.]
MKKMVYLLMACLLITAGKLSAQQEMIRKKVQVGQHDKDFELRKVGNYFLLNGDIIMGDDLPKTRSYVRTDARGLPLNFWPAGYIPVKISDDVIRWDMYQTVVQALTTLNTRTNVRFKPYAGEADYIRIDMYLDDPNLGGFSAVGKQGGEQILFLNKNMSETVVLHEMLHALGMWHEQSRADRDNYVVVNMSNVKDGYKHNFQLEPGIALGDYDYGSIMHYEADAFAKSADNPTIQCKKGPIVSNCKLGSDVLSAGDIAALNRLFSANQSVARIDLSVAFKGQLPDAKSGELENGVYRIMVKNTAKYLDIKDVSRENGAVLQQWDKFTEANQLFAVTKSAYSSYELKAMHSNKYLSVDGASLKNLAAIIQWDHANQNNQRFYITWIESHKGYIVQGIQSNKYWGLLGLNNGGLIIQQEKPLQVFVFEKVKDIPIDAGEKIRISLPSKKAVIRVKDQ